MLSGRVIERWSMREWERETERKREIKSESESESETNKSRQLSTVINHKWNLNQINSNHIIKLYK